MTRNAPNVRSANGIQMRTPPITKTVLATEGAYPERLIVAAVCWGKKYPDSYVRRLKNSVARQLNWPHEFVCLTDHPIEGVDCLPLQDLGKVKEGWWYKVQLFRPDLFPSGARILYLDLDVIVRREIASLAILETDEPLTMVYNFGPNRGHCAHNSSVMMWTAGDTRVEQIYRLFTDDVMRHLHGDQCWIWRVLGPNIANFPGGLICSYKYDVRPKGNKPPTEARIVVFHGDPKPDELVNQVTFVKEHWRC